MHSTAKRPGSKAAKPAKPYADFPLAPHAGGNWCKRIKGRLCYFGRWAHLRKGKLERVEGDGWQQAKALYDSQKDDLYAGRTPRVGKKAEGELTVADLANRFLTAKHRKLKAGRIVPVTFAGHKVTTDLLVAQFGKSRLVSDLSVADFEALLGTMTDRWGLVRLANEIVRVRSVFKFAYDNDLINQKMRYGSEFVRPDKCEMDRHKGRNGVRMLDVGACRKLLQAAPVQLKAMIHLGLNCGYGNTDCATLPLDRVDLDGGWIEYRRPKTGQPRRCPLWPETVTALKAAIAERPEPRQDNAAGLVFVTTEGKPYTAHAITERAVKLMHNVKVHRQGLGFYTLRHVFRTQADAVLDQVAIRLIMGHSDPGIDGHYRHSISDARLLAVTKHVRDWMYSAASGEKEGGEA